MWFLPVLVVTHCMFDAYKLQVSSRHDVIAIGIGDGLGGWLMTESQSELSLSASVTVTVTE